MAFDKAKTLQEANRYISQGKIGKAIKQYELAFEHEPSDLTLLNVIGDLYARENNVPEALKCFYTLAEAYTREGYKLKAISIYKKIVRLDRDNVDPLLRLAELSSGEASDRMRPLKNHQSMVSSSTPKTSMSMISPGPRKQQPLPWKE